MGKRWRFWPLTGFLATAVLGTLAQFMYRWSGGALLAGVFCAVNESVWEHMKLLFFPVFLFTAAQLCVGERDGLLAARAVSVTAGLALIPTLYYTYTGIWGDHTLWADAAIFYLSAAVTFWLDDLLHRQRRLWKMEYQVAGLVWLWVLAFLFVWWTFSPPRIALFRDPLAGLRDTVKKRRCPFGTAPFLLFLVEVEIAAIPAGPQCLGAAETDFFQVTEGVIVTFAEKTADFRTAA